MMDAAQSHIELLGYKASDKVTGHKGMIDSVGFAAYGCIQVSIKPTELDKDGKMQDGYWLDVTRIIVDFESGRVVDFPDFNQGYVAEGRKGPSEKHSNFA